MPQSGEIKVPLVPEAQFLHHPLGSHVDRQCPGIDFSKFQPSEADFQTGLSHFRCISLVPKFGHDSISQADDIFAVDLVNLQPTPSNEFAGRLVMKNPKPEAVLPPVVNRLPNAVPRFLFREWLPIGGKRLHHLGIGVKPVDLREMGFGKGLADEAGRGDGLDGGGHGLIVSWSLTVVQWRLLSELSVGKGLSMNGPELYKEYSWEEAVGLFGANQDARILCDGEWVFFPDAALCLTTLGDPPNSSHFKAGSRFYWAFHTPPIPKEVIAGGSRHPDIHLFVRSASQKNYFYVGRLGPSHSQSYPWSGEYVAADYDLRPTLPSQIWMKLGGFDPGSLDHDRIDAVLRRLNEKTTTEHRLKILREVAEYWNGPVGPDDGISEEQLAGRAMPFPLHWWYRLAGRRKEITNGQNLLLAPEELKMKDGLLLFYGENQWCYEWATEPTGDDPPVFGRWVDRSKENEWQPEGMVLSEFLIQICLFEAVMCRARYVASAAWIDDDTISEIVRNIQPIALPPWNWCGFRFWAGKGAFALVADNGEYEGEHGFGAWFGAKTEHPLAFLKPFATDQWDFVSI
jgi:hypothetical protein